MTLGNSPQPLTRRQLRELARENDPAGYQSAPAETPPAETAPAETPPHQDRRDGAPVERPESRHTIPPVERGTDAPAPRAPLPPSPRSASPVEAAPAAASPLSAETGRTLSRRELRALQAASSVDPAVPDSDLDHEVAAPAPLSAPRSGSATDSSRGDAFETGTGLHPPIGHWSVDREDDSHIEAIGRRDDETFDDLMGRGVGAGGIPTTTNALILPSVPRQGPGGPITSTGEIMITGSIDLPRSLGSTGQHPNLFDSSEMDRMLDQLDEGGHHNDVAPVSASRAVSTHTSTRGVMTPPRKRGASLPTVLAITAAVLAIGVLSLFVVGYALNIY
jgi:hypothetical protein